MPDSLPAATGPADDLVLPFQLTGHGDGARLLGRLVRMGPLVDDVLGRHSYPEPVARLLAEALALTATLAATLKYDGIFTVQAQGDGPVSLLVVDAESTGGNGYRLRGYARHDDARLAALGAEVAVSMGLFGKGWLAFTVDHGGAAQRYQGIVEIAGNSLAECAQHYFRQSQQLDVAVLLAARRDGDTWRAGGLILERIAEAGGRAPGSADGDDPWRRAMMLLATSTQTELLDPRLAAERLLFRLFHAEGLRVNRPRPVVRGCRCSEARIVDVLRRLPPDDVAELAADGTIEVTCEFCSGVYRVDPGLLDREESETP